MTLRDGGFGVPQLPGEMGPPPPQPPIFLRPKMKVRAALPPAVLVPLTPHLQPPDSGLAHT